MVGASNCMITWSLSHILVPALCKVSMKSKEMSNQCCQMRILIESGFQQTMPRHNKDELIIPMWTSHQLYSDQA